MRPANVLLASLAACLQRSTRLLLAGVDMVLLLRLLVVWIMYGVPTVTHVELLWSLASGLCQPSPDGHTACAGCAVLTVLC
jgi:hypothetical protein